MTIRLTLFTATLVQDSALSVSGLDRESSADQPFTLVGGEPTLVGRSLKGAAVAMAKRFFDPLPRAVSDDIEQGALRRSAWEFADATTTGTPRLRAGIGIRQKTGARAGGVLYDREVMPAGTRWAVTFRVDRSYALDEDEFREAEGILGYVLAEHWAKGRCWLGGGAARGLGWCHLEELKVFRLEARAYEEWVQSGRTKLPTPLDRVPVVAPTRPWCFRTLDLNISFGEYTPDASEPPWGLDMLAVGPHDAEGTVQPTGDGVWAAPSWAADASPPAAFLTDRAILMEGSRPLLPGASLRGPLRHAFSRAQRAAGHNVQDPHLGDVGEEDLAGRAFGTVRRSSRILIRDAIADAGWAAAKLHMHAEDEFSAGSYGSAKRDAVRVLKGNFPVRIVVEGPTPEEVEPLVRLIDQQVALGALGHLPVGGHKTRGAGWGRWQAKPWRVEDVSKARSWAPRSQAESAPSDRATSKSAFLDAPPPAAAWVRPSSGRLTSAALTLGEAARLARSALGGRALIGWWCEPTIDLQATSPPATFGRKWPQNDEAPEVAEVAFFAERAVWRAARTSSGTRFVLIEEVAAGSDGIKEARVVLTPARLHGFKRFSAAPTGQGQIRLREWHVGDEMLGFTIESLEEEQR
jgi:CRISPR/Cas system CSM-associated protein Csm3 (group 7 of RAMP superfamily)